MEKALNVNQTEEHETISLMGEVVIWQTFWHSLPWDFRTVMVKVSKQASSGITLTTGTAGRHSWALHSGKEFLPSPDTESEAPCFITKQPGCEWYMGFASTEIFWNRRYSNVMAEFTRHNKTKRFPQLTRIHFKCLRSHSATWCFLAPSLMPYPLHTEIPCFSWRVSQGFQAKSISSPVRQE